MSNSWLAMLTTFEKHPNFPATVASAIFCQISSIMALCLNIIHFPTVTLLFIAISENNKINESN